MCVAAIAWDADPDFLLVAIGNRDEFHDRPAAPLARWDDGSGIIAGRDLRAGGTWLGVTEAGRFALLTNFRDPDGFTEGRPSRGAVVPELLEGRGPSQAEQMNAFNAVIATPQNARFLSNSPRLQATSLASGVRGLSNGVLAKPWPKTVQLCGALQGWLGEGARELSGLFDALRTETPLPDAPAAAEGPQPDFAPVFIRNPVYGTRCSTVLAVRRDGRATIVERSFDPQGVQTGEVRIDFLWGQ